MPNRSPIGLRIALVLGSTAVALFLGWLVLRQRGDDDILVTIDNSAEVEALLEERAGGSEGADSGELRREPIDEERAKTFFPALRTEGYLFDPHAYYVREGNQRAKQHKSDEYPKGWLFRTNSQGLREDEDILTAQPDLRVLVTGDSHTGGVVPNSDSFTNVLEALLGEARPGKVVEALNAGLGGYSFYNYLGVLEKWEELEPDVFVVACYGGNDFSGILPLYRYFNHERGPSVDTSWRTAFDERYGRAGNIISQELNQAVILDRGPGQVKTAIRAVNQVTAAIARHCEERGIELVCLYIPPPTRAQPERWAERLEEYLEVMGARSAALAQSDHVADAWLAFLAERGIPAVDMRPIFQEREEELYVPSNCHINRLANRLTAEALLPVVEEALQSGS